MWRLPDDDSQPVIAAAEQIHSAHRMCHFKLPQTAILFFMSKGSEYLTERYAVTELPELFPCFLRRRPVWQMNDWPICFLFGGSGAPQAADSVETLAALGVKNIIAMLYYLTFNFFSFFISKNHFIIISISFFIVIIWVSIIHYL